MLLTFILFIFGLYVLVKGANLLVKEGAIIARYLGVSSLVIGILIAGIGTSIPEFAVTFFSNIVGENDVGMGTIIGSNIFNFLFILGLCALFYPIHFKKEWITRDMVWNILAILATIVTAWNGVVSRLEGVVLLVLCTVWILKVASGKHGEHKHGATTNALIITFMLSVAGLVGVLLGSYFVVNGAVSIAVELGVSQALVGMLIVGIGTSLPEITVSFAAARRRDYGMTVGNIIGSNIFDFLGIIGASALAYPMLFEKSLISDMFIALSVVVFVAVLAWRSKQYILGRVSGLLLLLAFLTYTLFVVLRG